MEDVLANIAKAEAARDDGMERAASGASPVWHAAADVALRQCAEENEFFTVDIVWDRIYPLLPHEEPRDRRAMGAVMRRGVEAGWIERTCRVVLSKRATRQRGTVQVWRSKIYQADLPGGAGTS